MVIPNGSKLESVQGKQDLGWWGAPLVRKQESTSWVQSLLIEQGARRK